MRILAVTALLLASASTLAQAAPRVKCDIKTLRDAESCMNQVAETMTSYNGENLGAASAKTSELMRTLRLIAPSTLRKAAGADFAGMMIEYGDETHIYYFKLVKGKNVSPVELYDLNLVDLPSYFEKPYSAEALNPNSYFIGLDGRKVDSGVYKEIQEYFKYASEE